ncbi:MAG TPA: hypothetical protein VGG41_11660 [Solirubrobacteraceae bacterium]|jgi:hypothetical protein
MPRAVLIAALYQGDTRLLVTAAMFVLFIAVLPRPTPRPVATVAIGAIVALWDFGATLIWGTAGLTKVRFLFALSGTFGSWLVLASAVIGTAAAAGSLRAFSHRERSLGLLLAGTFLGAFAFWSFVVRYSPIIAIFGGVAAVTALRWAATVASAEQEAGLDHHRSTVEIGKARLLLPVRVLLPILSGLIFYASLRWGPKSWGDLQCGATLGIPAFVAAVALSAAGGGLASRIAGRRTEAVVAAALLTGLVAAGICVVAFLLWFGQNHCGE